MSLNFQIHLLSPICSLFIASLLNRKAVEQQFPHTLNILSLKQLPFLLEWNQWKRIYFSAVLCLSTAEKLSNTAKVCLCWSLLKEPITTYNYILTYVLTFLSQLDCKSCKGRKVFSSIYIWNILGAQWIFIEWSKKGVKIYYNWYFRCVQLLLITKDHFINFYFPGCYFMQNELPQSLWLKSLWQFIIFHNSVDWLVDSNIAFTWVPHMTKCWIVSWAERSQMVSYIWLAVGVGLQLGCLSSPRGLSFSSS